MDDEFGNVWISEDELREFAERVGVYDPPIIDEEGDWWEVGAGILNNGTPAATLVSWTIFNGQRV